MRTTEIKIYTIDDHPYEELCIYKIRDTMHDLNNHSVSEVIHSINSLSKLIGGIVDYSLGQFPSKGEFISFKDYDDELLDKLVADDYPLTGVCWDPILIESMQQDGDADRVLTALHEDSAYVYSDEGIREMCLINDYEFTLNGEIYEEN